MPFKKHLNKMHSVMFEFLQDFFKTGSETSETYEVKEAVEGTWTYHLAEPGEAEALCGHRVMSSKTDVWRPDYSPDHIPTSRCDECNDLANKDRIP